MLYCFIDKLQHELKIKLDGLLTLKCLTAWVQDLQSNSKESSRMNSQYVIQLFASDIMFDNMKR